MSPRRPEIFVSATSADLRSCRQLVKEALLTLGCVPVEQNNFPPDYHTVREMLRAKIAACQAMVHLAGEAYGMEPAVPEKGEPRRSYAQIEYEIARELGKPLYVFVCGENFPYDAHEPEDPAKRELQKAHRARLTAGDTLRYEVGSPEDLSVRVRELQTRVEELSRELEKARSWLGRGLAAGLIVLAVLGGGLWVVHHHANRIGRQVLSQSREIADLRGQLARQAQVTEAILARVDRNASASFSGTERGDPLVVAQTEVAAQRGISVEELKKQVATEGVDVRQLIATLDRRRTANAAENKELTALQREALSKLGDTEFAAAHYREAVGAYQSGLALTSPTEEAVAWAALQFALGKAFTGWANLSTGGDIAAHRFQAVEAYRAALKVQTRAAMPEEWAKTVHNLANVYMYAAEDAYGKEKATDIAESIAAYRLVEQVNSRKARPQEWVKSQANIARALTEQAIASAGAERSRLLAESAADYRSVLEIYTQAAFPREWARVQVNFSDCLVEQALLAQGAERARLFESALEACQAAVKVDAAQKQPYAWAQGMVDLGHALQEEVTVASPSYRKRILVAAAEADTAALKVFTRPTYPREWAATEENLASALSTEAFNSAGSERAVLLGEAVAASISALEVHTRAAFPADWARSEFRLAGILNTQAVLSAGPDRVRLLRAAIADYRSALEVFTASNFPAEHAADARLLAAAEVTLRETPMPAK